MHPQRFKLARLASGRTLRDLSAFLRDRGVQLSHAALHKYETGASAPTARTIMLVAEAFGVRPEYFLKDEPIEVEWLAFRRHAHLTESSAERIKSAALPTIENQIRLQHLLGVAVESRFPKPKHVRSPEDVEGLASVVRRYWKLGEAPIPSMTRTIEDHGGVVVEVRPPRSGFDGLSGRAQESPVILVNAQSPSDRKRYNLAHELGHLVMGCDGIAEKEQEPLAHRFAAAFLVPASVATRELGSKRKNLALDELVPLKQRHGLSIQGWIRRAADLGIITPATYRRLCVQVSRRGWRKLEPGIYEVRESPVRLRQMLLRAMAENLVTPSVAEEMLPGVTGSGERKIAPEMHPASRLLAAPAAERDAALRRAAEEARDDYAEGGALRDTDLYETDLDGDEDDA